MHLVSLRLYIVQVMYIYIIYFIVVEYCVYLHNMSGVIIYYECVCVMRVLRSALRALRCVCVSACAHALTFIAGIHFVCIVSNGHSEISLLKYMPVFVVATTYGYCDDVCLCCSLLRILAVFANIVLLC